jgi:peptide deformylase
MAVRKIVRFPDPILKTPTLKVDVIDRDIVKACGGYV